MIKKDKRTPLDDVFETFIGKDLKYSLSSGKKSQTFEVDVIENKTEYIIIADLPGFEFENIKINYEDNYLNIEANRLIGYIKDTYIRKERKAGKMSRSFKISQINYHEKEIVFENGVLKLTLPKLIN